MPVLTCLVMATRNTFTCSLLVANFSIDAIITKADKLKKKGHLGGQRTEFPD